MRALQDCTNLVQRSKVMQQRAKQATELTAFHSRLQFVTATLLQCTVGIPVEARDMLLLWNNGPYL